MKLLVYELNEADLHFVTRYEDKLPTFARMRREGALVRTRIPGAHPRSWRSITPWIIWPTIYTGLSPEEHGVVAFGQDPSALVGRCYWDALAAEGKRVGVMGSLLSHPPREPAAFYVPETLADDDACIPARARPLQRFLVETARGYSEDIGVRQGARLTLDLARSLGLVRGRTFARALAQGPLERLAPERRAERALLQADLVMDAFLALVRSERPEVACVHSNHVAYAQHRFWRAAEPERFSWDALSPVDARFFEGARELKRWERAFEKSIERALVRADHALARLARLLDPDGALVVVTALGQRPFDPARGEIHNPVARLDRAEELLATFGVPRCAVRHQMNPDLTLTFDSAADARAGEIILRELQIGGAPLFYVQRRERQVFLELEVPRRLSGQITRGGTRAPVALHVALASTPDQSTAQHTDRGFVLAWSPSRPLRAREPEVSVTSVASTLLSLAGSAPRPWMKDATIAIGS